MKIRWLVVPIVAALLGVAVYLLPERPQAALSIGAPVTAEEPDAVTELEAPVEGRGSRISEAYPLGSRVPPGMGRLTGRLLGPTGASLEGMALVASGPSRRQAYTEIAADGSFDLHPLPGGRLAFDMVILDRETLDFDAPMAMVSGPRIRLGQVMIEAGGANPPRLRRARPLPGNTARQGECER